MCPANKAEHESELQPERASTVSCILAHMLETKRIATEVAQLHHEKKIVVKDGKGNEKHALEAQDSIRGSNDTKR